MIKSCRLLIVGLLLCAGPAFAEPISFEQTVTDPTGLLGWQVAGQVSSQGGTLLPPVLGNPPAISPTDGSYMAVLDTGGLATAAMEVFFGMPAGSLSAQGYTRGSGMKRDFTLSAGDKITFDWNFVSFDAMPFNDAALFIKDAAGTLLSSVALVGDFGRSGWVLGSTATSPCVPGPTSGCFEALTAGTYTIGLGVFDSLDEGDGNKSYLAADNFNVVPVTGEAPGPVPVPEPGTLLMLTSGCAALFTARRFRIS